MTGWAILLLSGAWCFLDGFFTEPSVPLFGIFLGAGLLLCWKRTPDGLALAAVHVAMILPLVPIMARLHAIPLAPRMTSVLSGALGLNAAVAPDGSLLLAGGDGVGAVLITWELIALPLALRLLVGSVVFNGMRSLPRAAAIVAAAAAARVLLLAGLAAQGARASLAYEPVLAIFTFAPIALLFRFPLCPPERVREGRGVPLAACAAMLALASGILLGYGLSASPQGPRRTGRVLIDESHSDWEPAGRPFNHDSYGQRSLYNFALFAEWLDRHYTVRLGSETLSDEALSSTDVLILKTPTRPYDSAEIARIERFVRRGGGLWLIGDHTNLFGMGTVLNAVAAPYGIAFGYDDTFPLHHEKADRYTPPWLARHPILEGIPVYPFETSCTLKIPWSASPVMIGRRLGAEEADWGHPNFFGNIKHESNETFGLFVQAAAVEHAEGRVFAFTDSTNFSNFSMLWPGRTRLALNAVDWLNRRRAPLSRRAVPALALAAGVALALLGLRAIPRFGWTRAAFLWLALGAAAATGSAAVRGPDPKPARRPSPSILFDTSMGGLQLAANSPVLESQQPGNASVLERHNVWMIDAARTGRWPVAERLSQETLGDHEAVVLVNPKGAMPHGLANHLVRFVERGGRLLVADTVMNPRSAAAAILAPFGIQSRHVPGPAIRIVAPEATRLITLSPGLEVRLLERRRGRVVLVTDSSLLTDAAFGGVFILETDESKERHQALKQVFDLLLEP